MASARSDGFGISLTENRKYACIDKFSARPPLLSGETVCEKDEFETRFEDLEGETQVLVGEGEGNAILENLVGDTQVVDQLDDGFQMPGLNVQVQGETQVWDENEAQTPVEGATQVWDDMTMNLGGETEVQDDEDCVRNVCSQFLRNGIDSCAVEISNESGVVKNMFCELKTSSADEMKLGHGYTTLVEQDNEAFPATPPSTVEVGCGTFQRSFTSIRAASLRASGLAARCKAAVEARNVSSHSPVEKENEFSNVAHPPGSVHNHDLADQEVRNDSITYKAQCSVMKKLFDEDLPENRNISNECNGKRPNISPVHLPDNDDQVAGLSYVDSQEPGESTQAAALEFIERFVKDNAFDVQLEAGNEPLRRTISKHAKGFSGFPKNRSLNRQPVDQAVSFDWDEELEDEGGGEFFCRMKEKILKEDSHKHRSAPQTKKSRKSAQMSEDKNETLKFLDKATAIQSDSKLLNQNRKYKVLDAEENIRRNLVTELDGEFLVGCIEEAAGCGSGIQEMFGVGPDTQIAAEAMEALFCGEPIPDGDVIGNQGNLASFSTVADSNSTLTSKILELRKKSSSNRLVVRKSKRKLNEKKGDISETACNRKCEDEVNGTHTTQRKRYPNDKVIPSTVSCRATRSMVLNHGSMLLNQADVTSIKDMNSESNCQFGVAIPKGRRSRKRVGTHGSRHQSDKMHSDAVEENFDESTVNDVSQSNFKTSGAESYSRRQDSSRQLSGQIFKSRDQPKSTKGGNEGVLNLSCDEVSPTERSVANLCSLDADIINKSVSCTDIRDHHSAKETGGNTTDCGMHVEVISAAPRTDKPTRRIHEPPNTSCTTPDKLSKIANARVRHSCRRQLPLNLSRSSLRKEISALLSNSPKSLPDSKRKRREINEMRVFFSNHLDDDVIKHQKKILARLGASLAFSIPDATHFIADSFVRTRNMLEAIALGKQVVTHLWLESCNQTRSFIDEKAYILRDEKKERELGFSMPDTLARACQQALLQNQRVIITPNSKPSKDIVARLVKAVHGRVVSSLEFDEYPDNVLILSCEEDYLLCHPFLNEGVKVYSSELLLSGIVTQRLDYARHRLFEDHVRTTASRRSRSKRLERCTVEDGEFLSIGIDRRFGYDRLL